jgi:hypothetical protein
MRNETAPVMFAEPNRVQILANEPMDLDVISTSSTLSSRRGRRFEGDRWADRNGFSKLVRLDRMKRVYLEPARRDVARHADEMSKRLIVGRIVVETYAFQAMLERYACDCRGRAKEDGVGEIMRGQSRFAGGQNQAASPREGPDRVDRFVDFDRFALQFLRQLHHFAKGLRTPSA